MVAHAHLVFANIRERLLYNTNPSFRLTDINGAVEPPFGWSSYSSVNPLLPEVHTHINNVINDVATNYDVDGIHLNFIRYIPGNGFDRLPHDSLSHLCRTKCFSTPRDSTWSNPAYASAYRDYVKQRITSHNPVEFLAANSIPPVPGDFDADGDVDSDDRFQWEGDYGLNNESDADQDNDSDGGDILIWQRNHTGPNPLPTTTRVVPEPSPALLLLLGLFACRPRK